MKAADELRGDIRRAAVNKGHATQGDLAKVLGISGAYLNDILKGRRRFTPDMVKRAAQALSVHPVRAQRWQRLGAVESGWQIDVRMQA